MYIEMRFKIYARLKIKKNLESLRSIMEFERSFENI